MRPRNVIIWAAMLAGVMMLGGVAFVVGPGMHSQNPPEAFSYIAVVMGVLGPVGGHVMRFTQRQNPARFVISFALAEGGALTAAVMWLLAGTTMAMAGYLIGAMGLASLYPGAPEDI